MKISSHFRKESQFPIDEESTICVYEAYIFARKKCNKIWKMLWRASEKLVWI